MRDAKLRLSLLGILLLGIQLNTCHGLCRLVNETVALCHNLDDAKYIDTYDLGTLKTSISANRLQPEIFSNLSSLRHLELTHGKLQHIAPGTFRQLGELESLDLSDNKIESLGPTTFDGLKKLHSLSLCKNAFTQIPTAVLSLKNLKILDFAGNPLKCNCQTLKLRDKLLHQGIHLSKRTLCSSPTNLKGKQLIEPDTEVICMFENQDKEMQMDQPAVEGSGEIPSGDPFVDPTEPDVEEHEVTDNIAATATSEEVETSAPTKSSHEDDLIIPATESTAVPSLSSSITEASVEKSTRNGDELFFSEENDKLVSNSPVSMTSTESIEEINPIKEIDKDSLLRRPEIAVEGSGVEEDLREGSGIEGSGTGVPPISWDIPDDETGAESSSSSPAKDDGWFSLLWDTIAGTSAAPEDDTTKDLNLQEEQFISASTERAPARSSKSPIEDELIVPVIVSKNEGIGSKNIDDTKGGNANVEVGGALDESKSGQIKAEAEGIAEATDASPARQPQKGMGSYVVLAILLGILGSLIGFAAYKGEFCKKKRKRNDVEGGTELKDMTKSLLDSGNGAQPKIASNGKLENDPLISAPPSDDLKIHQNEPGTLEPDSSKTRYSAVPDVVDPVKPPRKSFVVQEDPEKALTNGRSHQDLVNSSAPVPEVCLKTKGPGEPAVNGKNHHDSVSSLGANSKGSPLARMSPPDSIPTNGSLENLQDLARPPLSPGAQRVKITLQENPDSVPKTPILITRTKAGENLVKTP